MDHEGPRWRPGEGRCPVEQCSPVGMGREAVDRVDGGTDRNVMDEAADPLRAFDQASTERDTSLVASDQLAAFASRQVVGQMVTDWAGVHHSAVRNDYRTQGQSAVLRKR